MALNTEFYSKHGQQPTGSYARFHAGSAILSGILAATSATAISAPANEAFERAHCFHADQVSFPLLLESFQPRGWQQRSQVPVPSDEDFGQLAIDIFAMQKNAPREIDELIALHMSELYD